jgi:glycosyltransferase involved in cell wall biosynthesis
MRPRRSGHGGHGDSIAFVVPGPISTRTGGSIYDARIAEGLRRRGVQVQIVELAGSFPDPSGDDLRDAAIAISSLADDSLVVIDGLVLGAMPDVVEREADRLRLVALIHLPLGADVSREPTVARRLHEQERRALATTRLVVVTSSVTVPMLAGYGLSPASIHVVEPGTDRASLARGADGRHVHCLCVANVTAGKGHEILLRALAKVPRRDWLLTCAGSLRRDPATADRVQKVIRELDLSDRVTLADELDAQSIEACLDRADVFVLATLQETYGMAVAEALAHGLPVVSTATGAIPSLVGNEAGIVVPPGDADTLAAALTRVIGDAGLRARLSEGARQVRDRLPTWEDASAKFASALQTVQGTGS